MGYSTLPVQTKNMDGLEQIIKFVSRFIPAAGEPLSHAFPEKFRDWDNLPKGFDGNDDQARERTVPCPPVCYYTLTRAFAGTGVCRLTFALLLEGQCGTYPDEKMFNPVGSPAADRPSSPASVEDPSSRLPDGGKQRTPGKCPHKRRAKVSEDDKDDEDVRASTHYMALVTEKEAIDLYHGSVVEHHSAMVYQLKMDSRLVGAVLSGMEDDKYGISLYVLHTLCLGLSRIH